MRVKIYVEGGAPGGLDRECRRGFGKFLERAGLRGRMPRIIACGSRDGAHDRFCTAQRNAHANEFIILLVDSEEGIEEGVGPWGFLRNRDGWDKPDGTSDDNAHLMVQCMEAWFLADRDALAQFFGDGFNANPLPNRPDVENIPKLDLYNALRGATQDSRKGEYGKGRHSFDLLAKLNPQKVVDASPHAKRLVDTLLSKSR